MRSVFAKNAKKVTKFGTAIERLILDNYREHFFNSPAMVSSLESAWDQLQAATETLPLVHDANICKGVGRYFRLTRNRFGHLPRDQARQFFALRHSRLVNLDKSCLSEAEKTVLATPRATIGATLKCTRRSSGRRVEQRVGNTMVTIPRAVDRASAPVAGSSIPRKGSRW